MREGWAYKKLEEVCDFQGGSQPPKMEWSKEPQAGYVRMLQIRDFTQNATDYIEYVKESKSLKYCKEDDILIGRYGASVGKILTGLSGAYNVAIIKTIPREIVNKNYIKYYFLSPFFQHNLLTVSQHRAAQAGFSKEDISDFSFPLPPLSEQQRIVEELDLLSSIIEKKKEQLKELDNLAQSIFYDMFGDPIENPKGWEVKALETIGKIITGNTPSTRDERNYDSEDICFLKPSDIAKDSISFLTESEFHVSTFAYNNARKLPKGSVLVTCIGIVGKVGILEIDAMCNQQINAIIPNEKVFAIYVAYSLLSERGIIEDMAHAPVVPIINKGDFSKLRIPLPPLSLQQSFAEKIEAIEKQKEQIKQSIKEVETLFNSRMDYYFT